LLEHRVVADLPDYFQAGDVLILNDSRVIPARLRGRLSDTGGQLEVFLLEANAPNDWWAMLRPGKRLHAQTRIQIQDHSGVTTGIHAVAIDTNEAGHKRLLFSGAGDIADKLAELGEVPLPPYIKRRRGEGLADDLERYQTIYARHPGSVAAPTAGLHFTEELFRRLRDVGVEIQYVTLHVGFGTFAPVKTPCLAQHRMHEERFSIGEEATRAIRAAKKEGRRVIAAGTTSLRVLESVAAEAPAELASRSGRTQLFLYPPCSFRVVDALLTNFHLPCSTLLMLVSAFATPGETHGRELVLAAYAEAIRRQYRFFSYGDAMLIL
jgi:S-adenosylmethionine:tRNA ribosyltransferase-isomerase